MRAVMRSALFSTIAFTLSIYLASCGSVSHPVVSTTTNSGTGPVPTVAALAMQTNGVAPNRKQEVQFSEAMDATTINAKTFLVTDAGGNAVPGVVTYDSDYNVATFAPTPALKTDTQYSATITTGAASVGGMHLAANYSYQFTTRAATDTSPLRVTNVSPFPDEACVSATTKITITFNEAPDASTVTAANIVVTDSNGNKIPVSFSLSVSGTDVVVTPNAALPTGSITVTVSGIGDLADQMMQQPFTWTFTTACTTSGGGGGSGPGSGSNTSYVYVSTMLPGTAVPSGTTPGIFGWAVHADGTLVPLTGMPYDSKGAGDIGVAQNFVFGANAGGENITAWTIGSDGTLSSPNTSATPWAGTASEGPFDVSFDMTQKDLYANYSMNGTYQAYSIASNGSLSFVDYANADESSSWLSFTANDTYAYQSACYHGDPAIFGYTRGSDGGLTLTFNPTIAPQPSGGKYGWCPWGAATIGSSNVIVAEQPNDAMTAMGPWQMVNFAIAADGSLSTSDTATTAPTVTVGDVNDYRFDPTQSWLAVGGSTGVQIFHWANGKLTSTSTVPIPSAKGAFRVRWDAAGHLFVLNTNSDTGSTLYVFNVVNGVATPAPGSPVFMPSLAGEGLAVKPLS
jgi:Big-like domain-containing protein